MYTQQILELQKIEKTLFDLNLDSKELEEFFTKILNKKSSKKLKESVLPKHIKEGIRQSWENYANGEYVVFGADEEFNLENVEKKLAELESGVKQKPINF